MIDQPCLMGWLNGPILLLMTYEQTTSWLYQNTLEELSKSHTGMNRGCFGSGPFFKIAVPNFGDHPSNISLSNVAHVVACLVGNGNSI